jgi:hypothetical protein
LFGECFQGGITREVGVGLFGYRKPPARHFQLAGESIRGIKHPAHHMYEAEAPVKYPKNCDAVTVT